MQIEHTIMSTQKHKQLMRNKIQEKSQMSSQLNGTQIMLAKASHSKATSKLIE
jgi:hypothetical protein